MIWKNVCPFKVRGFLMASPAREGRNWLWIDQKEYPKSGEWVGGIRMPHLFHGIRMPHLCFCIVLNHGWYGQRFWAGGETYGCALLVFMSYYCVGGLLTNSNQWKKGVGKSVFMLSFGPYGLIGIIFCSEIKCLMSWHWWRISSPR